EELRYEKAACGNCRIVPCCHYNGYGVAAIQLAAMGPLRCLGRYVRGWGAQARSAKEDLAGDAHRGALCMLNRAGVRMGFALFHRHAAHYRPDGDPLLPEYGSDAAGTDSQARFDLCPRHVLRLRLLLCNVLRWFRTQATQPVRRLRGSNPDECPGSALCVAHRATRGSVWSDIYRECFKSGSCWIPGSWM